MNFTVINVFAVLNIGFLVIDVRHLLASFGRNLCFRYKFSRLFIICYQSTVIGERVLATRFIIINWGFALQVGTLNLPFIFGYFYFNGYS